MKYLLLVLILPVLIFSTGTNMLFAQHDGSSVHIVSQPVTQTQINQLYQYDVNAVADSPGQTICFRLHDAPDGMTIDSLSGLIQWTPTQPGLFEIEVKARICGHHEGGDEQEYRLSVFSGPPGSVDGSVRNDSGRALPRIRIRLFDVSNEDFGYRTHTDSTGHYSFPGVNPSTYFVRAKDENEIYAPQWYNGASHIESATPVVVASNSNFTADFTLHLATHPGNQLFALSGTVHAASGDTPLKGARVIGFEVQNDSGSWNGGEGDHEGDGWSGGGWWGNGWGHDGHHGDDHLHGTKALTDSNGNFTLHLQGGSYILAARAHGFLTQFWDHKGTPLDADHILLQSDSSGFNFALDSVPSGPGSISGTIRSAKDSTPLESHVVGFQKDGSGHFTGFKANTESDSSGAYSLTHLPAGNYVVLAFDHSDDVIPTFYSTSGGTPILDSASLVAVGISAVTGINIYARIDTGEGLNEVGGDVETDEEGGSVTSVGARSPNSAVPLVGALVVIKNASTGAIVGGAISHADGRYRVPAMGSGEFVVTFQKPGMGTATAPVSVAYVNNAPSTATVNAHLAAGPTSVATVTMSLNAHWNLVSVPVAISNAQTATVFPGATSPAFRFVDGGGYQIAPTLSNGMGYWVQFRTAQSITIQGAARTGQSSQLHIGWNLIGTISSSANVTSIQQNPPGFTTSRFFGYNAGYSVASSLSPGQAYWVKAKTSGTLTMNGTGATPKSTSADGELKQLNSITLKSGDASQTLYFGGERAGLRASDFELPPPGPDAGSFDARFASARIVEVHPVRLAQSLAYPILLNAAQSPVTISWSVASGGATYRISLGNGSTGSVDLKTGQGSTKLMSTGAQMKLTLTASPSSLPKEFALDQNYPNPFNPTTTIGYALPEDAHVVLKVFNLLGQEVRVLVNEVQSAGRKDVQFDASTLPSGLYFYRIEALSIQNSAVGLTQVRKMLLMK